MLLHLPALSHSGGVAVKTPAILSHPVFDGRVF
jgi:hypothetical protein